MKYSYIVWQKRCPACRYVLEEDNHEYIALLLGRIWFVVLPFYIPFKLIKRFGFLTPEVPNVGPKTISCPGCGYHVRTGNLSLEELEGRDLLNYKFRKWFTVAYASAGFCNCSLLIMLFEGEPIISSYGLASLILLLIALIIILIYRLMLRNCTPDEEIIPQKRVIEKSIKLNSNQQTQYCRKCGCKLAPDSNFCAKCGTKIETKS